ncbi:hypothetical protein ACIRPK_05080 [Kitasatospora sp. NPDC101801]|uniref:hypothetical protein n=1 Tax=Kitasatospora sp. NPDC101801 TaxID=3364103 RepID=UPI00380E673D
MKSTGKMALVGLALMAALMTTVLGLSAGWPVWMWAAPAAAALLLALIFASARSPESEPSALVSDGLPWEETRVDDVALPTRVPDYDFRFSATVWWRPIPNTTGLLHVDPASLAVETVLNRARELTERETPERMDLVVHRLNSLLGTQGRDAHELVEAMGGRVELRLPADDRDRLGKLSSVRKTEEVWEHERRFEQSKRAYLGNDVLKSPGSAVVWWLARHDDQVTEAVDMIGPLAQLSAAANDEAVDELYEHLVSPPMPGSVPLLDTETPVRQGWDGEGGTGTGPASHPGPEGPTHPTPGPRVVGPLNQFLDDVDVAKGSPERKVYAHRIAEFTDAMGQSEYAKLIREGLLSEDGEGSGPTQGREPRVGGSAARPGARWTGGDSSANGTSSDVGPEAQDL